MRRRLFVLALLSSAALSSTVMAQVVNDIQPPTRQHLDGNGVDRVSGTPYVPYPTLAIGGSGRAGLSVTGAMAVFGNYTDEGGAGGGAGTNWGMKVYNSNTKTSTAYSVGLGQTSDNFTLSGGVFSSTTGSGASLVTNGSGGYTYTMADGTQILYNNLAVSTAETAFAANSVNARATQITYPTGEVITLAWASYNYCVNTTNPSGRRCQVAPIKTPIISIWSG